MAQMNMDMVQRLKDSRERSLRLMKMDSKLNEIAKGNQGNIEDSMNGVEQVMQPMNEQYASEEPMKSRLTPLRNGGAMSSAALNMPKEIVESFKNNVIDDTELFGQVMSGDKNIDILMEGVPKKNTREIPKQIAESYGGQNSQPQTIVTTSSQVDYPMIKMIVEDVVKKYMSSFQKKILSEGIGSSSNELNTLTIGKTFKFLDKSGNVYEATLKKVTNINEMKNKR